MSWNLSIEDLAAAVHGEVLSRRTSNFVGISTDTRQPMKDKIFFALKGANFDAHDYLLSAVEQGAGALVVSHLPNEVETLLERVSIIEVPDTLRALQNLGNFWRHKMKAKILGVTGTNGKTTTKEFAATILSQKLKTQYSRGSFNNHWGVPISLLSIEPEHEVAVIEMGMNHLGEISELTGIADPDVVLVTMVGRGHLAGLGGIEGVARAKEEIYLDSRSESEAIFNVNNPYTRKMYENFVAKKKSRTYLFSHQESDVPKGSKLDVCMQIESSTRTSLHIKGRILDVENKIEVEVFGEHNLYNLMAAACMALAAGLKPDEIWQFMKKCQTSWGRNQWMPLQNGAQVLFDAYNANPESMKAAVENFAKLKVRGRKIAFIGEMREMGEMANEVHRELGEVMATKGFTEVVFVGPSSQAFSEGMKSGNYSKGLHLFDSYKNGLAQVIQPMIDRDDIILIKASRGMELERVLEELGPATETQH